MIRDTTINKSLCFYAIYTIIRKFYFFVVDTTRIYTISASEHEIAHYSFFCSETKKQPDAKTMGSLQ